MKKQIVGYVLVFYCSIFLPLRGKKKQELFDSVNLISIASITQKVIDFNTVILEGDVEVKVDLKIHLWADKVVFDKEKKTILATAVPSGGVILESQNVLIIADQVFLNLENQTGEAHNLRVHSDGKFIFAKKGAKLNNTMWRFEKVRFTACSKRHPDWAFNAESATLKKGSLRAKSIFFKIKDVPVAWAPGFIIPASYGSSSPSSSSSGFLIPRISWDKHLGFGFNQEYYASFAPHFDNLAGVNWQQFKGYVLYDEFRHARSVEDYTIVTGQFAVEKNAFIERNNQIVKGHDQRYTLQGKNFEKIFLDDFEIDNLIRIDYGTDKRIGYDFFGRTDAVEDQFFNNLILRFPATDSLTNAAASHEKLVRGQFKFNGGIKHEIEEKFSVTLAPHAQYDTIYYSPLRWFHYKQRLFFDQAFSRHHAAEKIYEGNTIIDRITLIPLNKTDTTRMYYQGSLLFDALFKGNKISATFEPNIQLRGKLKHPFPHDSPHGAIFEAKLLQGAIRAVPMCSIEWSFPQQVQLDKKGFFTHFWQPLISWTFVPRFNQKRWFFVDEFDRLFARNELAATVMSDWYFNEIYLGFMIRQGYEFYPPEIIFPLRRGVHQSHLLPLVLDMHFNSEPFFFESAYEFDSLHALLLQAEFTGRLAYKPFELSISLFYQSPKLQNVRKLLSDIPSFMLLSTKVPTFPHLLFCYEGLFYSPSNSLVGAIKDPHALSHRIRLEYSGHCWGVMGGFEEKRYRQQGRVKSEQSIIFEVKLESLGSISKQFRKEPIVLKAPLDYR